MVFSYFGHTCTCSHLTHQLLVVSLSPTVNDLLTQMVESSCDVPGGQWQSYHPSTFLHTILSGHGYSTGIIHSFISDEKINTSNTHNIGTSDLPDIYAWSPGAVVLRQIYQANHRVPMLHCPIWQAASSLSHKYILFAQTPWYL